ncbi:MAG: PAS domain-containing sensor histidine kinase [Candidatus Melainabacteria bacterium]|nr:PAS domain-containing sensor histidine kinase [Candidatus Melainabacteria bacterium]
MKNLHSLTYKGIFLVAVPLLFVLALLAVLSWILTETDLEIDKQMRSRALVSQANIVSRLFVEASHHMGSYMFTGSAIYSDKYRDTVQQLNTQLDVLAGLPVNAAEETELIGSIKKHSLTGLEILDHSKNSYDSERGSKTIGRQLFKETRAVMGMVAGDLKKLTDLEARVDQESSQARASFRGNLKACLIGAAAISVALCFGLAFFFIGSIIKRLHIMQDNSYRLSMGTPLNPILSGHDEIAQLDAIFHQMADGLSEANRKKRALVENAVDVICSIDGNGTFSEVSPACLAAWGYSPEELLGQRLVNIVVAEDKDKTVSLMNKSMSENAAFSLENRIKNKNGTTVDVSWLGSWSEEDKSIFCVVHDTTSRKKMERLKREFVQMVSHDLRMPLTSLKMTLSMLLDGTYGELTERGRPRIEYATSDLTRLINMINELLEFERMESGKIDLFLERCKVSELVVQAVESMRSLAEMRQIKIYHQACDSELISDGNRLVQVMINLLGNAIKFSPKNSAIYVSANEMAETMEFKIRDEGKGIPAAFKDKIFDRFEQVELDDARVKGGSGLGLAICKAVIVEHKGTIGVHSEEGKGSTFWFRIPLNIEAPAERI